MRFLCEKMSVENPICVVLLVCFDRDSFVVQSLLDDFGLADVGSAAEAVKKAVEEQQFEKATELWSVAETAVEQVGTTQEGPQ